LKTRITKNSTKLMEIKQQLIFLNEKKIDNQKKKVQKKRN